MRLHWFFLTIAVASALSAGSATLATWAVVGGTYGDRLLELRVTDDRRARLGWKRCAVRSLLCTVFPIGLLWVLVSGENRSVQDVLLRTSVVYD